MADRVDAGMKAMKATGPGRPLDDVGAEPELPELPDPDDAVLAACEPGDRSVTLPRAWMRFGADSSL